MPLISWETSMEVLFATSKVWVLNSLPSMLKIFRVRVPDVYFEVKNNSFLAGFGMIAN